MSTFYLEREVASRDRKIVLRRGYGDVVDLLFSGPGVHVLGIADGEPVVRVLSELRPDPQALVGHLDLAALLADPLERRSQDGRRTALRRLMEVETQPRGTDERRSIEDQARRS